MVMMAVVVIAMIVRMPHVDRVVVLVMVRVHHASGRRAHSAGWKPALGIAMLIRIMARSLISPILAFQLPSRYLLG